MQPDPKFAAQQLAADPTVTPEEIPSRFSKADMSFTALFATEPPSGVPTPLIGTEAAAPLIATKGGGPLALMPQELMSTPEPLAAIDSAMSGPKDDDADDSSGLSGPGLRPAAGANAATAGMDAPPADATLTQLLPTAPAVDMSMPRPRVLMTPRDGSSSAFLTQLYTQN